MDYFILWAGARYPGEQTRRLEGGAWGGLKAGTFTQGQPIQSALTPPIEIDLVEDPDGEEQMPPLWVVPALVVRQELAQALREAGVDNIEYFPAALIDRQTGARHLDYAVGNIVGVVDAIDMQKSVLAPNSPPAIAMRFKKMVLDEQKCRGLLLFRLMHRQSLVIVAGTLADHLRKKNFPYLHLIPPEKFA